MDAARSVLTNAADTSAGDYDERFALMRPRLLAIARSLAGQDAAEDIVQDTYLRGRERIGQLRQTTAFDAWLARIAVNASYNHHRGLRRFVAEAPLLIESRPSTERRDVGLRELIERLPPRHRTVVVLHYGHGYGLDEIGLILGLTHTNVRSIVHRARKRLAAQWDPA